MLSQKRILGVSGMMARKSLRFSFAALALALTVTGRSVITELDILPPAYAGDGSWIRDAMELSPFGGEISAAVEANGNLFLTYGHRLALHSGSTGGRLDQLELSDPALRLAASRSRVVVELSSGAIGLAALEAADQFSASGMVYFELPSVNRIASLVLLDKTLIAADVGGRIVVYDTGDLRAPRLLSELQSSALVAGSWWVMDVTVRGETAYAILYDGTQPTDTHALIAIRADSAGAWQAELLARVSGQQARDLEISGNTAVLRTVNDILLINLADGSYQAFNPDTRGGTFSRAISAHVGELIVLGYVDPSNQTGYTLSAFDLSDSDSKLEQIWSTELPSPTWDSAKLAINENAIYLVDDDLLTIYPKRSEEPLSTGAVTLPVGLAIRQIAGSSTEDLIVARRRELCTLDLVRETPEGCLAFVNALRGILQVADRTIVFDRDRVVSVDLGSSLIEHVDEVRLPEPQETYVALVPRSGSAIALVDANPPREVKTQYRLDTIALSNQGTLNLAHSEHVETAGCETAGLAQRGDWMGMLCGRQLIEFGLQDGIPSFSGTVDLPEVGLRLAVGESGPLAVGTSSGLLLYDFVTREQLEVSPDQNSRSQSVFAIQSLDDCILTVQGDPSAAPRSLWRYCRVDGGAYLGDLLGAFDRRGGSTGASIAILKSSAIVVTGEGYGLHLRPTQKTSSIWLPRVDQP
jgi:hypothetical protein